MIYYLGVFRTEHISSMEPEGSTAQDVKMEYIIDSIKSIGRKIVVLSQLSYKTHGVHRKKVVCVDERERIVFLPSIDFKHKFLSKLSVLFRMVSLFFYLAVHIGRSDSLIVYNGQALSLPVRCAKALKGFNLTLELEELFYLDSVNTRYSRYKTLEKKLVAASDQFIVASDLLKQAVGREKRAVVLYGAMAVPPKLADRADAFTIHVIYAGGIDALRRVDLAIDAMRLLPANYELHICGTGNEADIKKMLCQIEEVNCAAGRICVHYHGLMRGSEFDALLQQCHIGLNLQEIGTGIEVAAFPSKITAYLCRGLNVVSSRLVSIEQSKLDSQVTYYDDNTPSSIASAILSTVICSYSKQVEQVKTFDLSFKAELQAMLRDSKELTTCERCMEKK